VRVECRGELALVSYLLDRVFVFLCSGHVVDSFTTCIVFLISRFSVPVHYVRDAIDVVDLNFCSAVNVM